jgi:hypothetical protein
VCAAQACFSFSISEEVFFTGQAALALEFWSGKVWIAPVVLIEETL